MSRSYGITREAQDAYSLESQKRTAAAQAANLFDDEIVPLTTIMKVRVVVVAFRCGWGVV